jgi:LPS-assembly protein
LVTRVSRDRNSHAGAEASLWALARTDAPARQTRGATWAGGAAVAIAAGAFSSSLASASPARAPYPTITPPNPPAAPAPLPDDGLRGGGFYIEADELSQNQTTNNVTARGHVVARYGGRTLRADELSYDSATGIVVASGGVTIINPDGTAEFSQSATLDKSMSQGVAQAFSTRLAGQVSIAGATLVRKSPTFTELNEAIFTPCPVCAKHPNPTWSIKARQAVQDKKRQIIYFRDAVIEVHGLPVFYTPVFWQADPSVPRKSGFLPPIIGITSTRGFSWEQPYLWVISPSEDVVLSPQINQKVNPFLNLDWRKRFYSGAMNVRAGYTDEQDFDSHGNKLGNLTSRSYVLADGLFAINQNWQWGFTGERTSDPLIFDKYSVPDAFSDRGLYAADDRRLISQGYVTRQDTESYLSVAAIQVQGLRSTDINSTFPVAAPLIEGRYEPAQPILGGRLRIEGSGVVLNRDQSPADPTMPGIDSRRATLQADWQRSFIVGDGLRIDPFLQGRADYYYLINVAAPYAKDASIVRAFYTAGATISWPFFKRSGPVTWILSPIAQVALSPATKQDPRIPNEDSVDFELDSTNLFRINKSPGFDLYEGGQRLNVAEQATAQLDDGRYVNVMVGRSFRTEPDPALPPRTGLSTTSSDWLISAEGTPLKGIDFFTRWRLDSGTFSINRLEIGVDATTDRFVGSIRYLDEAQDPNGNPVKDLDFSAQLYLTKHWGISAYGAREFQAGAWRERDIGIIYRDDCVKVEVIYHRSNTFNGSLGPSSGVALRLSLATLGNSGYSARSTTLSP